MGSGTAAFDADACTAVLAAIEALREACTSGDDGCSVMQGVALCAIHRVQMPSWLGDEFVRRHVRVKQAEAAGWNEAFGLYWPRGTRLDTVRRRRELKRLIHAQVWRLAGPGQTRAIDRGLFEEIGATQGIGASGSSVEKLYYEAIKEGMPSVALLRRVEAVPG